MSQTPLSRSTDDADFEAIANAVMETARGRWFLMEYARRNRNSDTRLVVEMLGKIERTYARRNGILEVDRLRGDLDALAEAITRAKSDMIAPGGEASSAEIGRETPRALETIVITSERTTGDILNATERIQEVAWVLRERGLAASVCNELDALITEIYSVCKAQDLNHRRIVLLADLVRLADSRVAAMLAFKRREDAEAHALAHVFDENDLRALNLPTLLAPELAPQPMASSAAPTAAPAPAAATPTMREVIRTPQPIPPVAAPTPEPPPAPEQIAVRPPPVRPAFERLTTVERMALFS